MEGEKSFWGPFSFSAETLTLSSSCQWSWVSWKWHKMHSCPHLPTAAASLVHSSVKCRLWNRDQMQKKPNDSPGGMFGGLKKKKKSPSNFLYCLMPEKQLNSSVMIKVDWSNWSVMYPVSLVYRDAQEDPGSCLKRVQELTLCWGPT